MSTPRRCEDCQARMQTTGYGLRCPWATSDRHRLEGDATFCDWPYPRPRVDTGEVLGTVKAESWR